MTSDESSPASVSHPSRHHLVLMRHAKSDWSEPSRSDHDRPLNDRGLRDAPRMAGWLTELGRVPDLVLCSSAERTRQTAALLNETWGREVPISFTRELYLASPDTIMRVIRSDGCDATCLLVIAHNPGMTQAVSWLANRSVEMPTAAMAVFDTEFRASLSERESYWSQLRVPDQVKLRAWMAPKMLPAP